MRLRCGYLTLVLGLGITGGLTGQPPPPPTGAGTPPPAPVEDPRLNQVLAQWEKDSAGLQLMAAKFVCKRQVPALQPVQFDGIAKFMRPEMAMLHLKDTRDPERRFEKFIFTGSAIYDFKPAEQTLYVHQLAKKAGQPGQGLDEGPMPFLFGMKADTAKKRYQLKVTKQDDWWTYIDVVPNFPNDQKEFHYARIVIDRRTGLPGQIYWVEPNKTEITWDIKQLLRNREAEGEVTRRDFEEPKPPQGWKVQVNQPSASGGAAQPSRPNVIRPQN